MRTKTKAAALFASLALLAGCASTSPGPALRDVAHDVEVRSGHALRSPDADDAEVGRAIDAVLAKELTVDGAVRVALLANPKLRSELEEVSISQADLVQAGLLSNPTFTIGRTAWESEHIAPNLFASIEQSFLDVLTLPLKKRIAGAQLEATKLDVGDHVLELASEVRAAFFTAQAAEQIAGMRRIVNEASQTAAEIAKKQTEAGTMSDLNLRMQLGQAAQTKLDLARAEGEAAVAREELNKKMGVWGHRTGWRLPARLPELPAAEVPLGELEAHAIGQRLDVAAARRNLQAMQSVLTLAKTTRWVGKIDVAVEAGRLRHSGRFSFGPSVSLEIPLFDQRQAQIARLEAYVRRAERDLEALAIDVRADVRASRARVLTARGLVTDYTKTVVPLREDVVRLSQEQYDAMLLGVYQLLAAKQSELDAYRESIEALRDYWIARSDLERAVGARVGEPVKEGGK